MTGTAQKVDNAGMKELLGYHTARAGKELKRNVEKAMLGAYTPTNGTSLSPRVAAGAENWIYTDNHIKLTNQTGSTTVAPAAGIAGAVTAGTATAYVSANLNSGLQQAWSCGGNVDTICVGPTLYNTIAGFTSLATRFRDVGSRQQAQIIGSADVNVSAFGSHNLRLNRQVLEADGQDADGYIANKNVSHQDPYRYFPHQEESDEKPLRVCVDSPRECRLPAGSGD